MKSVKKVFLTLLTIAVVACVFEVCSVTVSAETIKGTFGYYSYLIWDNGEITITDCDESISGDVVVPETIDGYPVTSIFEAFMDCDNITSITVPDSVRSIGEGSFSGCDNLKTINLGNGITRVEQFLFVGCESLESIEIPDNVTEIGLDPFYNCSSLESIKIGKNVELIESCNLSGCVSLKRFIVDEENANFSNDEYGVLFNKDKTELLYYPVGSEESTYIIPEGVVSFGAFRYCSNLKCIEIPASTLEMLFGLFEGTDLEKITINNKHCSIAFDESTIPETAVIYGYTDSTAEAYANKYNRKFEALDADDNADGNDDVYSAFVRFFESFADLIKAFFNRLLAIFSIV